MTVMHAMRPPRHRSAATSTAEVEGFLLSSLNLKIKAEPSFFCPLTGCLLLSPVRLVNSGSTFEARSLDEYFKRAGKRRCPMTGRRLDEDWVVIEPDDDLRARIHAWAKKKHINLDALEVAAYKLRDPNRMLRTLSDPEILSAAFPAGTSVPLSRGYLPLPKKSAKITTSHMPHTEAAGPQEDKRLPQPCLVSAKAPLERQRSVSAPRCIRCAA
ncbi:hypothetical protein CVIRNUC_006262 [Coccomyxa viridis]|uniref:U-box domain-containing protein n=1 Tax=Coccomyxa viridis TaxID=1274662 RepID=A0AAV1I8M6_9CHLO|nr:hypothetical protein CVIRNUC_006262 [Coccomyxa viridis]